MSNQSYPEICDQTPSFDGDVLRIIAHALAEDIGSGDITSQLLIPEKTQMAMLFEAREEMIVCGTFIPALVFEQLSNYPPACGGTQGDDRESSVTPATRLRVSQVQNPSLVASPASGKGIDIEIYSQEGESIGMDEPLLQITGPAQALLTGERVALNLMQRMSGVATLTRAYVEAVAGTNAVILDTRKTMPGLRALDKYAVRAGGGQNHRMGLYDMVIIKDNHIAMMGGIAGAIYAARAGTKLPIEVECDTYEQVMEALGAKPDRILLDNMDLDTLRRAVDLVKGQIKLEASGGVSLDTVRDIAQTGVDFISIGKLTHSAPSVDIGADVKTLK